MDGWRDGPDEFTEQIKKHIFDQFTPESQMKIKAHHLFSQ